MKNREGYWVTDHERECTNCGKLFKKTSKTVTLETSDIVIPDVCPILGMPLEMYSGSSGGRNNSPALDRIDNDKGYTKDNIQVISHLANVMKASASKQQLIDFAHWVLKTFEEN